MYRLEVVQHLVTQQSAPVNLQSSGPFQLPDLDIECFDLLIHLTALDNHQLGRQVLGLAHLQIKLESYLVGQLPHLFRL